MKDVSKWDKIQSIHLNKVLPNIFRGRDMAESEVWDKSLTLERGKVYLIEAASGTGKTCLLYTSPSPRDS